MACAANHRWMPLHRPVRLCLATALVAAPLAIVTAAAPAHAAAPTVTVTTYDFKTSYTTSGGLVRECNVVGDLYVPSDASPTHRVPAILTTNGFSGSKADQAGVGTAEGAQDYITLSYSGLGFGGTGCPITDDDPSSDGQVASQLVSFLGGATGIGYTAFSSSAGWSGPVTLDTVQLDSTDHLGHPSTDDPRVGMVGGSYGGEIQLAAAGDDPRIDTIVPLITWHDLSYSLTPGNASLPGDSLAPGLPGVGKVQWDEFFFGLGTTAAGGGSTSGPGNPQAAGEPQPSSGTTFGATDAMCPGFQPETCAANTFSVQNGYADPAGQAFFTHSSVTSYLDRIHIPVFFGQGENDTLFNLQEASATYTALEARGVPVKMMWQSWGHSQIGAAPGEYPSSDDPSTTLLQTYQGGLIGQWFDHYLKGTGPAPALDFSYFRDYAYTGTGTAGAANEPAAAAAYGEAPAFPITTTQTYHLSGTDALVPAGSPVATGTATDTAVPMGHSSYSITDDIGVVSSYTRPSTQAPPSDDAGTFAGWTSAPLTADTDVVGMPTLDVSVASGEAQTADPGTQLVMFAKLYDVAADGTTLTLPARVISPVRVPGAAAAGAARQVRITLPGIVHRFAKGHALRVVLASGDDAYTGNPTARTAMFATSPTAPGTLTLPVVPADATAPVAALPESRAALALPLVGLLAAGGLVVLRRRRC